VFLWLAISGRPLEKIEKDLFDKRGQKSIISLVENKRLDKLGPQREVN